MKNLVKQAPIPKYWQLVEYFRAQIEAGALKPGDRLPSLNEMYEQFGASRPTVEKAHTILEEEGLIERRHGAMRLVAQPKKRAMQGVLGLSGPGFRYQGSFYWSHLMEGICEAADRADMQVLLLGHRSTQDWEKVDGLLLSDWNAIWALPHLPPELPRVSVLAQHQGVASVGADDYTAGRIATQHLLEQGHRRIAYLHGKPDHSVVVERRRGYRDALQEANVEADPRWEFEFYGLYDLGARFTTEGHKIMLEWLRGNWRELGCTALLCHNDETAIGVMQAFQKHGIRVPDDVSVMGFDGTEICDLSQPQLTSIELPLRDVGERAVEMLLQQIKADEVSTEHQILPVHLRPGKTVARWNG